jgi:hypothetical protein
VKALPESYQVGIKFNREVADQLERAAREANVSPTRYAKELLLADLAKRVRQQPVTVNTPAPAGE